MTKPDDIPQDVWRTADAAGWAWADKSGMSVNECIARAIMEEREACAVLIEQRNGLIPDRQEIAAEIRNRGGTE